jgi:hypothetical protein
MPSEKDFYIFHHLELILLVFDDSFRAFKAYWQRNSIMAPFFGDLLCLFNGDLLTTNSTEFFDESLFTITRSS